MWRIRCSRGGDEMERGNTNIALPATKPNEHRGGRYHTVQSSIEHFAKYSDVYYTFFALFVCF